MLRFFCRHKSFRKFKDFSAPSAVTASPIIFWSSGLHCVCVFVAATARGVQAGAAPADDERRYGLVCPAPWRRRSLLPASDGALSGTIPRSRRSRASSGQTGRVIARPASATSFHASTRPSGRIGCAPVVSASRPWGTSLLAPAVPAVARGRACRALRCRRLQTPSSALLMAARTSHSGVVHATTSPPLTEGSVRVVW